MRAIGTGQTVLLDVQCVAPCMPGATLSEVDGNSFTGKVKVKVGPIVVIYSGTAEFVEQDAALSFDTPNAPSKRTSRFTRAAAITRQRRRGAIRRARL
jgi:hypothetical protein